VDVFGARLTPLAAASPAINPVLGGSASGPAGSQIVLALPAGALAAQAAIALTPVGAQALQHLVPPGWSPLSAVDVAPHALVFAAPASLTLPTPTGAAPGAHVAVVRYDDDAAEWIAIANPTIGGATLSFAAAKPGEYAVLLADTAPLTPP